MRVITFEFAETKGRTCGKVSLSGKGRNIRYNIEVGTMRPNGSIRWTPYNKLKKQLNLKEKEVINSALNRALITNSIAKEA